MLCHMFLFTFNRLSYCYYYTYLSKYYISISISGIYSFQTLDKHYTYIPNNDILTFYYKKMCFSWQILMFDNTYLRRLHAHTQTHTQSDYVSSKHF